MKIKPQLSFWQIWNMSFGFLGVQIGYALQNANTSRILQSLGANVDELSYFWLAAPLAGLVVQPIIGLFSDRTWTKLGRRIPFILGGAALAGLALVLMPNAEVFIMLMSPLLFAAIMLLFMDMSFNVTMQPFRALVADMLNDTQKTKGYSVQTFLINCGAVVGSVLPFVLVHWFGLNNQSTPEARIPDSVAWSYYIGGALLLGTVLITAFRTKEYPPAQFLEYNQQTEAPVKPKFMELIKGIPKVMWQLGVVQFFTWSALFLLWTYTTPAIAANVWGTNETTSAAYSAAGDWVGVLFGVYAVFAGLFSIVIPKLAARFGNKAVYAVALLCGAAGYLGMAMLKDQWLLLLPMLGIGIAWGAILALPYAILAKSVQAERMGVYMGVFNFTITLPQIFCGLVGGMVVKYFFHGDAISMIIVAAVCMLLAALSVGMVTENGERKTVAGANLRIRPDSTINNRTSTIESRPLCCIFDLDGVLVDTAKYHYLAWKRLAAELGFDFSEQHNERLKGVSRMASLDILLEVGGIKDLPEEEKQGLAAKKNTWYVAYINQMTPHEILPGVMDFLQELKANRVKTALGSASRNAPLILKRTGLASFFDAIIDGNVITKAKPDPEVFLLGAQALGVTADCCLVFEDAEAGVEAARRAGMMCVGVGDPGILRKATLVIPGFEGLTWQTIAQRFLDNRQLDIRLIDIRY